MKKQMIGIGFAILMATGATVALAQNRGGGAPPVGSGGAPGLSSGAGGTGAAGTINNSSTGDNLTPGLNPQAPGINTTVNSSTGNTPTVPGSVGQTIPGQPGTSGTQVPRQGSTMLPPAPGFPGGVPQPAPGINEPAGANIPNQNIPNGNVPVPNNNPTIPTTVPGAHGAPGVGGTGTVTPGTAAPNPNTETVPNNIQRSPGLQGAPGLQGQQPQP